MRHRQTHQDVSGQIDVCNPTEVREEVSRLIAAVHPDASFDVLNHAFDDFVRLFEGRYPGYHACDTRYHDLQHSLDVTLAMARLIHGHERTVGPTEQLGPRLSITGVIVSLFHDSGYIRSRKDTKHQTGAEYTLCHIARSSRFLFGWLARQSWLEESKTAAKLVHFTGYEIALSRLRVSNPRHWRLGCLLGTADLIAQMSGRTYLERCRDYLYDEFVSAGIAVQQREAEEPIVLYASPEDLLRKTPEFFDTEVRKRLQDDFGGVYRFASLCFGGRNPYLEESRNNIAYLRQVIDKNDFSKLRRSPSAYVMHSTQKQNAAVEIGQENPRQQEMRSDI